MTVIHLPVVTFPLSGLPDSCPHCGEAPRDGRWPLGVTGHRLTVECPSCFTAAAHIRAVAATDPECE